MDMQKFAELNKVRCEKWHPMGLNSWSLSDWMTALVGEVGELASLLKMLNRERDGLRGNKFEVEKKMVADELADIFCYLDLLAQAAGVDLASAVKSKFNEVSVRNGFEEML